MGSPEKPIDVEMGDMSEEAKLNPTNDEKTEQNLMKKNGDVKERFTGLKKEDLLKISNEPKWVRARWALFILFWIIWIAMLVGAILIVVNAPRCKPEPTPQWYQDTVVYEVNAKEFAEGFTGLKNHLPYIIDNLHAATVLLTGVTKMSDPSAVAENNDTEFEELIKEIHNKKGKVLIDVAVDSLPTSSSTFAQSASAKCADGNSGENCDLFLWKDGNYSSDGWKYIDTRNGSYKVTDSDQAVINYSNEDALTYILSVLRSWFDRGVDGLKIRDISNLASISQELFVETIWNELFDNHTNRALFVYSSKPNAEISPVQLTLNESNTAHSPVFLTAELSRGVNQNDSGWLMENIIRNWREQSRNVGGYVVSPVEEKLAASRLGNYAAGLNLLSMALPGVPILRSGDELAALSPVFEWNAGVTRDSVPLNGSQEIMKQTRELIVRRVAGIQAKHSLRYDTRDNDTFFNFLDVGQKDIIAFTRKWDKKSTVLVVSNLSPWNHTEINLAVENGLMKEKKLAKKAAVLVTSALGSIDGDVKLEKVQLDSGTTLILETA